MALLRQAVARGEFIPLGQFLRETKMARSTFYLHPEIPQIKIGGRRFVARVALEARR
ncbi:hypothetical protein [Pseudoxanthomonas japonensis]|uniref:hypothetical protein n=1 Tax=Pseudoxanthomonas japonensis TaxID=69284 RepID=UPI001BCB0D0C|nr:hypothetical protein [Pseudoxanthomonas japonensis]